MQKLLEMHTTQKGYETIMGCLAPTLRKNDFHNSFQTH